MLRGIEKCEILTDRSVNGTATCIRDRYSGARETVTHLRVAQSWGADRLRCRSLLRQGLPFESFGHRPGSLSTVSNRELTTVSASTSPAPTLSACPRSRSWSCGGNGLNHTSTGGTLAFLCSWADLNMMEEERARHMIQNIGARIVHVSGPEISAKLRQEAGRTMPA